MEFLHAYKALKQEQGGVVYNGNDVFVVLLTGFGKIICFQAHYPSVFERDWPARLALAIVSAEKIVLASRSWMPQAGQLPSPRKRSFADVRRERITSYWYQNIQEGAESTGQAAQLPNNTTLVYSLPLSCYTLTNSAMKNN